MYVDDSGTPYQNDITTHYVIAGVIVHECELTNMEKQVQQYKIQYFTGEDYQNEEIHLHEIYKSRGEFVRLSKVKKYRLLDNLYLGVIEDLPITIIAVGIDKIRFRHSHPSWSISKAAWTFLTERFDTFVSENSSRQNEKGLMRIDQTSNICKKETLEIVNHLRKHGSYFREIINVAEEPLFLDSKYSEGLQLADAISYCTLRHLNGYEKFDNYWKIVYSKLRRNSEGTITDGYGLKIFP